MEDIAARQDNRLRSYRDMMLPCFERIQESAARLAGLMVEAELVQPKSRFDSESRVLGLRARDEARARLAGADSTRSDAHFHHHLTLALDRLTQAWAALEDRRDGLIAAPDPLPALRACWAEMQAASRILPGFDTVDFRHSCCALHHRTDARIQ